ncbi:MAG: pseudouridine synthase, partial [Erysipelotrichaceae bacterium]|nr:pseudouridine synthase [Erysipelotrichaceae bacterium]
VDGIEVLYRSQIYLMMNKPAGYVCANEDRDPTVFDLFEQFEGKDLFTVGRLDKDTEGLLLITNDGEYAHKLTSPKHHVEKEYYVTLQKPFDSSYIAQIEKGIRINEEEQCAPAKCIVEDDYHVRLIIREGKFHQVKRMIHACENETEHLVRLRIGNLWLDETLEAGEYREMTDEELVLSLDREDE